MTTINAFAFKTALTAASKIATAKANLPILGCVHLQSKMMMGWVIEATDIEMSLRISLACGADGDLNTTVPAKTLIDVIASIAEDALTLTIDTCKLLISTKGVKSRIATIDPEEFPLLPVCAVGMAQFPASMLKMALKKVVIATSNDESRPSLMGVQISGNEDRTVFAAADGFRLAVQNLSGAIKFPVGKKDFLIPGGAIRKLVAMLPDDSETFITVSTNDNASAICFAWGEYEVFISLLNSQFPEWSKIIPADFKHILDLPADLPQAVKRAEVFGKLAGHLVSITPSDDGAVVRGVADTTGESRTVLSGIWMPFPLGLNAVFLTQGLEAIGMGGAGVHLHLNSPNAPILLTNGSREYEYLVMPMIAAIEKKAAAEAAEKSVELESQA